MRSKNAVELAARVVPEASAVPLRLNVNVALDAAVFVTAMFVTIVVVEDGVVYSVVLDVDAAPLKRIFDVVAISYYPFD